LIKEDCSRGNIELEFQRPKKPILIEGDPEKLRQVVLNLVRNAMEAMHTGGRLILKPRLQGDKVEVTITDTGPGISAENQAKLFTPFFTTKDRGTGLGLCVSKRIIEDHPGSSLRLESKEGKGTVAKIVLPVRSEIPSTKV
jgi:signal transduction histidine kinase